MEYKDSKLKISLVDEPRLIDRYTFDITIRDNKKNHTIYKVKYNTNYIDEMQSTMRSTELKILKEYEDKINEQDKKG